MRIPEQVIETFLLEQSCSKGVGREPTMAPFGSPGSELPVKGSVSDHPITRRAGVWDPEEEDSAIHSSWETKHEWTAN